MKKKWLLTFVVLVALSALSVIGASAADETTTDPTYPCTGYGMLGGRIAGVFRSARDGTRARLCRHCHGGKP